MPEALDPVTLFLLCIAGIFLIGALGEITFQRTNVPDVIWLIFAGVVLGPVLGLVTTEMLRSIAPYFAALTLVVVLFEGGSALRLAELSRAAPRSSLLALSSFGLSVAALAGASVGAARLGLLPETWTWTHGVLLGAILGGSSSIIIMPAMAQAKLSPRIANLVNLESALTDAFCVVGTSAIIDVMLGGGSEVHPGVALAKSFGIGLSIGAVAGLVWILFLRFLQSSDHAFPVTLSALLVLYVVIDNAGGSAALGILTVAILLGNAPQLARLLRLEANIGLDGEVRGFHRQLTFMVKSFFFVFIGAMLTPPWGLLLLGALLALGLLIARMPAVWLATLGSGLGPAERKMVSVCLPRGMAAGVLATLPMARGVPGTEQLPVLVFACVLTTILIFAVGFPLVKKRLPMEPADRREPAASPSAAESDVPSPLGSEDTQLAVPPLAPSPARAPSTKER